MSQDMSQDAFNNIVRRNLLQRGLRCDGVSAAGRDLVLERSASGSLDLAFVAGIDNLGQALSIAVTTPLGGDVFNTDFGFDGLNALTSEVAPLLQRERIRIAIVNLLRKDSRVSRIVDVKLLDQRLEAPLGATPRTLDVQVAFETVSSERLTLTAGAFGTRLING